MHYNNDISAIGVDLGGTKVLAGKVCDGTITSDYKMDVPKKGTVKEIVEVIFKTVDKVFDDSVSGIGIGVPSIVDIEKGIVYDVQNIPSWKEVHLKKYMEERYHVPVYLNNDANCFAIGEKYFGKGKNYKNVVALIVGTGIAAGIIIDNKLYNGYNCGAGEFGMIQYLDHHYEYYGCGQFFENVYQVKGSDVYTSAQEGDKRSIEMFEEMGSHLGNAIKTILYTYDPEIIILGGSVSQAYPLFKKTLWQRIKTLVYKPIVERIKIEVSDQPDIAILGAAALYYDTLPVPLSYQN